MKIEINAMSVDDMIHALKETIEWLTSRPEVGGEFSTVMGTMPPFFTATITPDYDPLDNGGNEAMLFKAQNDLKWAERDLEDKRKEVEFWLSKTTKS